LLALREQQIKVGTGKDTDLVFGVTRSIKRSFATVCHKAGLDHVKFHDLRHSAITRMINAGIPHSEVMRVSGHTQISTFLRYLNPNAERISQIGSQLEAFLTAQERQR